MTISERFWTKVTKTDTCWLWMATHSRGHGRIRSGRGREILYAHRWAYEELVGPIPHGLTVDHLCRNRSCVNPAHMEVVTMRENVARGFSPSAVNARKTHCIRGHAFSPANTYSQPGRSRRQCRACIRIRDLARRESA